MWDAGLGALGVDCQHGNRCYLRTGSAGCRNFYDWKRGAVSLLIEIVGILILVIDHKGNCFGCIHWRTTADTDDEVDIFADTHVAYLHNHFY